MFVRQRIRIAFILIKRLISDITILLRRTMIDKLRGIAVFSTVVDQGSFRGASKHLGLAASRVSEIVSELERDLGVTLLYRSTRQISLTHEGQLLHGKALDMIDAAATGLDAINPTSKEPTGQLRITTPAFITQTELMLSFSDFTKTYPKINLHFHFSDHPSDLIKDGFDVAIRAGWLEDSNLLTRKIGDIERRLVASADYVSARPVPTHPTDLADWDWIGFVMRPDQTALLNSDGTSVLVSSRPNVSVNSAEALYEFAIRGLGLTAIPENLATRGFERGDLEHVLPEWTLQPLGIHAVWPSQAQRESLTTLFVRFVAEHCSAKQKPLV
ncbi:MAG: LysR substrate-binding domain-containing protein [Pseudomonadota bacterium]